MARKDNLTGKGPQYGNTRSKALNANRRRWNVNLQSKSVEINGQIQQVMISTKTIRTIKNKGIIKVDGKKVSAKLV